MNGAVSVLSSVRLMQAAEKSSRHNSEFGVVESNVPRKLSAWLLIVAFSVLNLPPFASWATGRHGPSCCSSASCCRNGQCAMANHGAAMPMSGMPMHCSMAKSSAPHGRSISCTCSVSPAASVVTVPVHSYLFFDSSQHAMISPLATSARLRFLGGPSILAGFPHRPSHPPKLHS
jgi:hypothetical protein